MIAPDDANKLLQGVAADLKSLSYEELKELATGLQRPANDEWCKLRELNVDDQKLQVAARVSNYGLFRPRISVELIIYSEDGTIDPRVVPSVYFERFKSGRLYPAARIQKAT
jgi:hypothetical protein